MSNTWLKREEKRKVKFRMGENETQILRKNVIRAMSGEGIIFVKYMV